MQPVPNDPRPAFTWECPAAVRRQTKGQYYLFLAALRGKTFDPVSPAIEHRNGTRKLLQELPMK